MQSLLCTVTFVLVVVGAVCKAPVSPYSRIQRTSRKESGAVNCREAGWNTCCHKGECLAPAGNCFCDRFCHEFRDCCDDINFICPRRHPAHASHACTDGKVRIVKGKFQLCTNGTFKAMCEFPEETVMMLEHKGILKRQTGGGVGSGGGNLVEVGFSASGYTVSESEESVMVCVEVKSGELEPTEVALLTLTTASGSALAVVDYVSVTEDVVFDGNTFLDPFCVEIFIIHDTILEPVEFFIVSLSSSSLTVTLDDESVSATVFITAPDTSPPGDSCAEVGFSGECCVGPVENCQSLNSNCFCDNSCFARGDCCEDIFDYAVEMKVSDVSVEEGNTVIICAALSGRFLNTTEDIIVGLSFIDTLLAVRGEDYEPSSTELVLSASSIPLFGPDGADLCIAVSTTNDEHVEEEHLFTVEIVSVSPSSVISCSSSSTTTVHILDNDFAKMHLTPLPATVPEELPLNVCVRIEHVDYTSIPLSVNVTITSEEETISNFRVTFPVGELAAGGQLECYEVSLDNNVLEWSWVSTVSLEISDPNLPINISTPDTLTLMVVDDEVNSVSVSFESAAVQVTAGHRTVLCVVLEGLPGGGMTQDLSVSTQLVNRTAVLGTDYRLGDTSGLYTTNSATVLVFRRGSSIDRRQCLLVDTFTAPQCREYVHFNMTLSSTTPPVGLQEPLTASVSFTDSNTSCLCPKISIEECGTDTGCKRLLLAVGVLTALSLLGLSALAVAFCCFYRHHKQHSHRATANPMSDGGTMIRNVEAEESTDHNRTRTLTSLGSATYDSFRAHNDSATREALQARNRAVRSMVLARDSDDDDDLTEDYLQLQPAPPAVPTSTHHSPHIYDEPTSVMTNNTQPSSTLL